MRSVRLFLAGHVGSLIFRPGMTGFWLTALLFLCPFSLQAQNGRGTNGGAFVFATNRVAVSEKDGVAYVVVTRNSEVGKMQVDLIARDGTATNGQAFRFTPATNTITFDNLQTAVTVQVPILDNGTTNAQGSVNATFALANPRPAPDENPAVRGTIGSRGTSQLVILDEDRELEFNIERTWYQIEEPQPTNSATIIVNVVLAKPPTDQSADVAVDFEVTMDPALYTSPAPTMPPLERISSRLHSAH